MIMYSNDMASSGDVKHGWSKHGSSRIPSKHSQIANSKYIYNNHVWIWLYSAKTMFTSTMFSRRRKARETLCLARQGLKIIISIVIIIIIIICITIVIIITITIIIIYNIISIISLLSLFTNIISITMITFIVIIIYNYY